MTDVTSATLFAGMYVVTVVTLVATFMLIRKLGRSQRMLPNGLKGSGRKYVTWVLGVVSYPISWLAGGWVGFYGGMFVADGVHRLFGWPHGIVAAVCTPLVQLMGISAGCLGIPLTGFFLYSTLARIFAR